MFIAITRTEVPVAHNKYPEEAVEKILDVAGGSSWSAATSTPR